MKNGVVSSERLLRLIHEFIEKTGDKYIDGYELIDFLNEEIGGKE